MKTATVTWITYNNYGTELQAFALQKYLESRRIDNTIISDHDIVSKKKPPSSASTSSLENSPQSNLSLFKKYIFHPFRCVNRITTLLMRRVDAWKKIKQEAPYYRSQELFSSFKQNDLKILLGKKRDDMDALNLEFDAFICGSDQIWSVFDYNFDGYFFLNFVKKRKISYAASIGTENFTDAKKKQIADWLSSFDAISTREQQTAIQLQSITNREITWVADPTLLQTNLFWEEFCQKIRPLRRKYILCYFLENSSWYFNYAEKLSSSLGLELILIPSNLTFTKNKHVYKHAVGPKEFVSLIAHADFVLTDSYHGSIFAIQFNKKFLYLQRFSENDPFCQNIRVHSLFDYLELNNLIVPKKGFSPSDIHCIDYNYVNRRIEDLREQSRQFIITNLG